MTLEQDLARAGRPVTAYAAEIVRLTTQTSPVAATSGARAA